MKSHQRTTTDAFKDAARCSLRFNDDELTTFKVQTIEDGIIDEQTKMQFGGISKQNSFSRKGRQTIQQEVRKQISPQFTMAIKGAQGPYLSVPASQTKSKRRLQTARYSETMAVPTKRQTSYQQKKNNDTGDLQRSLQLNVNENYFGGNRSLSKEHDLSHTMDATNRYHHSRGVSASYSGAPKVKTNHQNSTTTNIITSTRGGALKSSAALKYGQKDSIADAMDIAATTMDLRKSKQGLRRSSTASVGLFKMQQKNSKLQSRTNRQLPIGGSRMEKKLFSSKLAIMEQAPIHRSKDEVMLLKMQNIFDNKLKTAALDSAGARSQKSIGSGKRQLPGGGDIAEVISSSISSSTEEYQKRGRTTTGQLKFATNLQIQQNSRNRRQESPTNKTEEKKSANRSVSIGYLTNLDMNSQGKYGSKKKSGRSTSHVEFHEPIVVKTDEKEFQPSFQRFKASNLYTFGKKSADTSLKHDFSEEQLPAPSKFEVKRVPTILIDKSRSSVDKLPWNRKKKVERQGEWPSEDLVNKYVKDGFKYQKTSTKVSGLIKFGGFGDSIEGQETTLQKEKNSTVLGILKQNPEDLDKLYELPFGELKASERVNMHRKRSLQDIALARRNVEIEIKFREMYEKDLPDQFKVMPNPKEVFTEKKAIDTIKAIEENNILQIPIAQNAATDNSTYQRQPSQMSFLGVKDQIQNRSGSTRNQMQRSTTGIDKSSNFNMYGSQTMISISNQAGGATTNQASQPAFKRQDTKVAPGVLSNNLKSSNVMKFLNAEHKKRVAEQERLERKRQHYQQTPPKTRQIETTLSAASGSMNRLQESTMSDAFMPFGRAVMNKRAMSIDTNSSVSVHTSQLSGSNTTKVRINLKKDLRQQRSQLQSESSGNLKRKRNAHINNFAALNSRLRTKLQHNYNRSSSKNTGQTNLNETAAGANVVSKTNNNDDLMQIYNYPGIDLLSDPVQTTKRLYKEVVLLALQRAKKMFEYKEWQGSINLIKEIIPLAQYALELHDTMILYKLIATIEYNCKQYDRAREICHVIIYMCSTNTESLNKIRLEALKISASSAMRQKQYEEALHDWKLCFEHSLRTYDDIAEIEVYEQMSYCYFYLGKMKKAEYFNTRFLMGVLEEQDSQVRAIYASLRKNDSKRHKWDQVQYVAEIGWRGETIFELFYNNFLEDCQNKERIIQDLIQGKSFPIYDHTRCELTKVIATSLLQMVGRQLRKIKQQKKAQKNKDSMPSLQPLLELEPQWRKSYYFKRRKDDCEDLKNLRFQIYKTCEYTGLSESLPSDLQCELEIISDQIQSEENLKFNAKENLLMDKGRTICERQNRIIKFPKLGMITVSDYDLPEMPSPTMTNIESVRFDFKSSLRNQNFRTGKKYESQAIKDIFPQLYTKKFQKDSVPRQYAVFENNLPNITDEHYKQNLIERAMMKKSSFRDLIFMSHMTKEKDNIGGKFVNEEEHMEYKFRYFNEIENKIKSEIAAISSSPTSSPPASSQSILRKQSAQNKGKASQNNLRVDLTSSEIIQLEQSKQILRHCMPIRAFIYGQDLTRELIGLRNRQTIKENEQEYADFSDAALNEKIKTIGNHQPTSFEQFLLPPQQNLPRPIAQKHQSHKPTMFNFQRSISEDLQLDYLAGTNFNRINTDRHQIKPNVNFQSFGGQKPQLMPSFKSTSSVSSDSDVYFHGSTLGFENELGGPQQPNCQVEEYGLMSQLDKALLQNQRMSFRKNSMRRLQSNQNMATPLKFNLAEVIYEEDNELTMTQIKEHELPSNSGKKTEEILKGRGGSVRRTKGMMQHHKNSQQLLNQHGKKRIKLHSSRGGRSTTMLSRQYQSNQIEFACLESLIEENNDGEL